MRPTLIAEVAQRRAEHPNMPLWAPLGEFLDEFYDKPNVGMLADEPAALISKDEAAFLSASTEYLCTVYKFASPEWVCKPQYFLKSAYWPECYGRAMEAIFLAESPVSFRRRFIFTEGRPLRRKMGPSFAAWHISVL